MKTVLRVLQRRSLFGDEYKANQMIQRVAHCMRSTGQRLQHVEESLAPQLSEGVASAKV